MKNEDENKTINEVYPRKQANLYGLDSDQVVVSMEAYCAAKSKSILEKVFGVPFTELEKMKIFEYVESCVSEGFLAGMELMGKPSLLRDFYEDEMHGKTAGPSSYEFERGKGVSGVLLPSGKFMKCLDAEHYLVVHNEDAHSCLYFSSKLDGKEGVVSVSPLSGLSFVITEAQTGALVTLEEYMDQSQIRMLENLLQSL